MVASSLSWLLPSLLLSLSRGAAAVPADSLAARDAAVDSYVATQEPISYQGILNNIGPSGSKAQGADSGVVIASPSTVNPDYFFTWTRDAALTLKTLIDRFINGDASLQQQIDNYLSAQAKLQQVSNPSGGPDTGGLGEPKYNVNITAFTGSWGRPQRDGPALRTTALVSYARWLIANGQTSKASDSVWPVIAKDIAYVVRFWNETGFDLWEEVNGSSFFTTSAQHRALVEGNDLAKQLGKDCAGCADAAPQVLCFAQSFWNGQYIVSNINTNIRRTGLDANSILSSLNTFDQTAACTDATFQPCSARALSNHKAVVDSFRPAYAINANIPQSQGVAIGRYTEDVYFDGNPWYLTTFAAAEQLYSALYQWNRQSSLTVTDVSLPFFTDLVPNTAAGTYASTSNTYKTLTSAVRTYADSFLAVAQKYTPPDGALAEQFSRQNGTALSAADLTWSYAAFLTASERRASIVPGYSWSEPSNNSPPATCTPAEKCTATVSFSVRATTTYGENIYVVGSIQELGNWDPSRGVKLDAGSYTAENPVWKADVKVAAGESRTVEYKYVREAADGSVKWEGDPNRSFAAVTACGEGKAVEDTWR